MAYLNEDGLETLVGKIKGQVIELTSAEYRQLPATKNSDNKLYFVNDEAYAYQIDDEPTSGSTGLVKSGGVYNWTSKIGSGTLTTTAQTIIPAVNEVNAKISHKQNTLTITSLTSTAVGSGVTINSQSLALYGKVLQFSIDVTLASQISQYGSIVSLGGKSAAAGWCHPIFSAGFVPSSEKAIYGDSGNQNIRAAQTLPAGRYYLIGMILTT